MDEYGDEHTSWRDGLRVEIVYEFLSRAICSAEAGEMALPHIVICHDEQTGSVTYSGPFPDGLAALVFAERECAMDSQLNEGAPLGFRVAALFPTDRRGAG